MIEQILKIKEETQFDFREFAAPDDPLAHLFDKWVDYYRLKYSICKAIQPKSILEIGVRYGYSAAAFLAACGSAAYTGIDNDSTSFGGICGAIDWARRITKDYKAEFVIADTQTMNSLPGEDRDFIHIDGQQDGDGIFHDLEIALEKGSYILLDGYFWSKPNMLSATFFLEKYARFIEYSVMLPGYAGELLIKTRRGRGHRRFSKRIETARLQDYYDATYYLEDCGGYDAFEKTGGRELEDVRHLAVYHLADPAKDQRILDIGCGRGELSFALSLAGADVTGIDYSKDSIDMAEKAFEGLKESEDLQLTFMRCDVLDYHAPHKFDKVVAADIIEHVEKDSVKRLMVHISRELLKEGGTLVIHTSPNKLNYLNAYETRREMARQIGLYLPANPRTYYEDIMHINEQTPAELAGLLKEYFKHVHVWVSTLPDLSGSLVRDFSNEETSRAASIFAVASNSRIKKGEIVDRITQKKLNAGHLNVVLSSPTAQLSVRSSGRHKVPVTIHNMSKSRLVSLPPFPVNIAYHWIRNDGGVEVFDGIRTPIRLPLSPGEKRDFLVEIDAPGAAGEYLLQISLVQEGNFWFEKIMPAVLLNMKTDVL